MIPDPPAYLTEQQRGVWQQAALAAAADRGWDTVRVQLLEAYTVERSRWLWAEGWLRENGEVLYLRDDKGSLKAVTAAPHVKIARDARANAIRLASLLGLVGGGG